MAQIPYMGNNQTKKNVTPDQVKVVTVSGKGMEVVSIEQSLGYMRIVIKDINEHKPLPKLSY